MTYAVLLNQLDQLNNPDGRVIFDIQTTQSLLSHLTKCHQGPITGDYLRYGRCMQEIPDMMIIFWSKQQSTVKRTITWDGCSNLVDMIGLQYAAKSLGIARMQGQGAIGHTGIAVSSMRELQVSLYSGEQYDNNTAIIIPKDPQHLPAIWCFCSSPEYNKAVREIDQALKVTNATLVKVPFDLERWQKVADEQYPDGLPEPHSDDPTQWLFRGDIPSSTAPLHVAMARLLGYSWPDQLEDDLGSHAVSDGILPLSPLVMNESASSRLRALLQMAYQSSAPVRPRGAPAISEPRKWDETVLPHLLAEAGTPGKPLDEWLRNHFFEQHTKLFQQRPFLWHIWDGHKDGFSAVVNYHRLDTRTLERLTHVYLGEWIERQASAAADGDPTATSRLAAAQTLKIKLEAIRVGEPPYDIYVRWKKLHEQPLGWNPDINDGVRLNIRPFVTAGILRSKVNVSWNKDRGTDPEANASGTTERLNDLHFTTQQKRDARIARGIT